MRWITAAALILSSAAALPAAEAQPRSRFEIKGVVVTGDRFRNASLRISTPESPYVATVQTNPFSGDFKFKNVPAGNYLLEAYGRSGTDRRRLVVQSDIKGLRVTLRIRNNAELRSHLRNRFAVSAKTLAIPEKAIRDYYSAEKLIQKDDYNGATRKLEHVVEVAPQFTNAWLRLGSIAFFEKRLPDAERYFRGALDSNAEAWEARLRLGQVLLMQRKAAEAVPVLEEAVRLRPRDPTARSQLALTLLELKDYDKALPHLLEAKRLDPRHYTGPQLWLARIYAAKKDMPAAKREVEEFLALHPNAEQADELRRWLEGTTNPPPEPRTQ